MIIQAVFIHGLYAAALISAPLVVWCVVRFNLSKLALILTLTSLALIMVATLFMGLYWAIIMIDLEGGGASPTNVTGDMADSFADGIVSLLFLLIFGALFFTLFSMGALGSIMILLSYWLARVMKSVKVAFAHLHRGVGIVMLICPLITLVPYVDTQDLSSLGYSIIVGGGLVFWSIHQLERSQDRWEIEVDYLATLLSQTARCGMLYLGAITLTGALLVFDAYLPSYRMECFTAATLIGGGSLTILYLPTSIVLDYCVNLLWSYVTSKDVTLLAYEAFARHVNDPAPPPWWTRELQEP